MSDTDARRILVPVGDSDSLRDTVSYVVDSATETAPAPVEIHLVLAARTQAVSPDAPTELGTAREQLERVALWVEEETAEGTVVAREDREADAAGESEADADGEAPAGAADAPGWLTVVTDTVGTDRYLFSPGDYADALLEYAAAAGIDRIVVDPEYKPGGTASMLQPMSVELARGDVPVETAPVDRPTEGAVLARAASLSKYLSVFVVSYLFYMSLSAWKPLDFFTGFVTASIVSLVLAPVVANRSAPLGVTLRRLARLLVYAPYLVKEIAVANLQVAYVVLHPDMPIDPEVVQLRAAVWGDGAVTTLANSITLTPGTLTVNVSERSFDIHSLTADSRADLFDGGLERAVRFVFYGRAAARIPTPRERGDAGEGRDG
ncbi:MULTISPECIES: monovalent cation/H+ antiporter subunit E [Halorubrum]|uniref:Cation:proton antiporter n=1 Tax=Halorubrum ezzemoulense TaxID=337243 RepID=A0A256JL20_HALEZ|nr:MULTISPECIES: monovalent cation/H+ antiporter subunit E [Halorubrum]MDB2236751.1 monovalent cation/H+ antiporter subunit E [Halorubrum ezzemoulense]MDB2247260.1 monovalent cation/H+ antiporter subunit E [Halorubrum ezzemoulense]MDB2260855.1 monovalent cation/H+ antiporter subunit E [Halorubrum ezzemoulense]MDB2265425.1 monovalent cation/H+ antiporter subunit E [Halorubrum ezzemoulense]MDB2267873.1 monovalent cation/H+ antiporter subunit E [Halorubrum ezzemoulense]